MKKHSLLVLFLAGCSNLHFDPVEYDNLINIKELTMNISQNCDNIKSSDIAKLKQTIDHQYLYTVGRSGRDEIKESIKVLKNLSDDLSSQYKNNVPSTAYCKSKMDLIDTNINFIIKGVGEL